MYPESYTPNSGSYDDVWRGTPDMKHHVPRGPPAPHWSSMSTPTPSPPSSSNPCPTFSRSPPAHHRTSKYFLMVHN